METHVVACKCGKKFIREKTVKAISACPKCNVYCHRRSVQ